MHKFNIMNFTSFNELKLIKALEYFLSLHEADEIYNLILDDKTSVDLVLDKLNEFYNSYNIKTTLFKNQNDLEQFVEDVRNMRDAQKKYFSSKDKTVLAQSKTFEKQIDIKLKSIKEPTGIFL